MSRSRAPRHTRRACMLHLSPAVGCHTPAGLCILVDGWFPQGLDDSELLRRARVDANAFGAFYRRHARAVYRSLLSGCGDPDVALDLTAETFARALQSLGRFRGLHVSSGRAWIFAIANSLLLQYQRDLRIEDRARRRLGILEATRSHADDDSVDGARRRGCIARPARPRPGRIARRASRACCACASRTRPRYEEIADAPRLLARGGPSAGIARDAPADRALPGSGRVSATRPSAWRRSSGRSSRAAARQLERRRIRRRRAIVLVALAAPLVLAAAASVAASGLFSGGVEQQLSTLRDDRLIARSEPASSGAFGDAPARPGEPARVADPGSPGEPATRRRAAASASGSPGSPAAACPRAQLTPALPIDLSTDYGPHTFRIYGLAMDGVKAISLQARGATRRVLMGRNAFYFEDQLAGRDARLRRRARRAHARRHDTARAVPRRRCPPSRLTLPNLPGIMPVGNTAA